MSNEPDDRHDHDDHHEPRLPEVGGSMPPIDFNTFVLSLASAALIDLGEPGPDGKRHAPNLPMARHHIDLVALIQEKTRGNLTGEEERLLHQVVYDLRMRFIKLAEAQSR
ncbi:MAG: DUF1844 domain-containing protein [Polyangiales bacterium]